MEQEKKGLALTVVNINYPGNLSRAESGAPMDACYTSFNEFFDFSSMQMEKNEIVFKNVTKDKLQYEIDNAVKQLKSTQYDYLAVMISSHGERRGEQFMRCVPPSNSPMTDGDLYPVMDLLNKFCTDPYLRNIQKIFIFQFCRDDQKSEPSDEEKRRAEDRGIAVEIVDTSDDDDEMMMGQVASGSSSRCFERERGGPPPCIPGAVVVFASSDGKTAYCSYDPGRDYSGGWLPAALHKELEKEYKELQESSENEKNINFLELLIKVNNNVSGREYRANEKHVTLKAAGTFNHQLTQPIILKMKKRANDD